MYLSSGTALTLLQDQCMVLLLLLLGTESQELGILGSSLLGGLGTVNLFGKASTLALQDNGGNQALDLGGLGVRLLALLLGGDLTTNDKLADIVILGQVLRGEAKRNGQMGK